MRNLILVILTFFVVNTFVPYGFADSVDLVKSKKEEEKRRKNLQKSKYKLSNYNLHKIEVPKKNYGFVLYAGEAEILDPEKTQAENNTVQKKDPQKEMKYWRDLKSKLEEQVAELSKKVDEDQLYLNQLITNYISMNLPLQKIDMKNQIDKFTADHNKNKLKLESLQNQLNGLPERARKAGVPPGWVR
jgi:hypothetical protein